MAEKYISFSKFILKYRDDNDKTLLLLSEKLGADYSTFLGWVNNGKIPSLYFQERMEEYFGKDFKNVVFDGKVFARKPKITRPNGEVVIYETSSKARMTECISVGLYYAARNTGDKIPIGRLKGYKIDEIYVEVE